MRTSCNLNISRHWKDLILSVVLGLAFACSSYQAAKLVPLFVVQSVPNDRWFEGDMPRVYTNLTSRDGDYSRVKTHPLLLLVAYPATQIVQKVFHLEPITAVRVIIALIGFLWVAGFFSLLRLLGIRRLDSVLFSLLLTMSAASVFWFSVPETFSFGSLSIVLALIFVALPSSCLSPAGFVVMNLVTFGVTITNWMAGIFVTMVSYPLRRAMQIFAITFCLATVLWVVEKHFFPTSTFFFGSGEDAWNWNSLTIKSVAAVMGSFFYHTMVMPAIAIVTNPYIKLPVMLTQPAVPGAATFWGTAAVLIWTILLIVGVYGLFSVKGFKQLRIVLGLLLLGQLGMHLVYGPETFLYSLHFVVLLVTLVALGSLTRLRVVVVALLFVLIPCVAINNGVQFKKAIDFFRSYGQEGDFVKAEMLARPHDPWPRGAGHVILAYPGTEELNKAYYEPGGSFSPSANSFGVSIWVMDKKGNLVATSDSIPMNAIQQKLMTVEGTVLPGVSSETPYYQATWMSKQPGKWTLNLKRTKSDFDLMLVVRSVGPAGGPVRSIQWQDGRRLMVNEHWSVLLDPPSKEAYLGDERQANWVTQKQTAGEWLNAEGWAYAKLPLSEKGTVWSLLIEDPSVHSDSSLKYLHSHSNLQISLPDERFVDCLNAQVAHLMMGLVGLQTHPVDPLGYSIPRQRDAAHIIVALAQAGQLEISKQLAAQIIENDFWGGFGPEADAPGLGIWTLQEIADRVNQPEYDQTLWLSIKRKAEWIEKMLYAQSEVYGTVQGPLEAGFLKKPYNSIALTAQPVKNGLIQGRVGYDTPVLYVNAVSYLGLRKAANMASRTGHPDLAQQWQKEASTLGDAWQKWFISSNPTNPLTYSNILWPSMAAVNNKDILAPKLKKRGDADYSSFANSQSPRYLILETAHQWLLLNESDPVWKAVQLFWGHQSSSGLYTWGDKRGIKVAAERWDTVRGVVNPSEITPDYRIAAAMLSLQLDMLTYLEEGLEGPTIVIGAGIPKEWLNTPMHVKGMSLPQRIVDWEWDGKQMQVMIHGANAKVKLGPAFQKEVPVLINQE